MTKTFEAVFGEPLFVPQASLKSRRRSKPESRCFIHSFLLPPQRSSPIFLRPSHVISNTRSASSAQTRTPASHYSGN